MNLPNAEDLRLLEIRLFYSRHNELNWIIYCECRTKSNLEYTFFIDSYHWNGQNDISDVIYISLDEVTQYKKFISNLINNDSLVKVLFGE